MGTRDLHMLGRRRHWPRLPVNPLVASSPPPPPLVPPGVFALGANLAGMDFFVTDPTAPLVPSTAEIDYLYSLGCRRLRIPIKWEYIQPTLNGALSAGVLASLQGLVTYTVGKGMKALIDIHSFGQYNGIPLNTGAVTQAAFANLWQRLATAFLSYNSALVAFDLMNEPVNVPTEAGWVACAKAAITAIRTVDSQKIIYVEGWGFASTWNWLVTNPTLHTVRDADPSNQIIISGHCYMDHENSGLWFDWNAEVATPGTAPTGTNTNVNIVQQRTTDFVQWLIDHNFRGHIGELGCPQDVSNPRRASDEQWQVALNNGLTWLQTNNVEVDMWSAGGFWGNYPLSIDPYGGRQSRTITTLQPYWGNNVQPTAYFASGPSRGTGGVASSPFYIDYRGKITGVVVVTPTPITGGVWAPANIALNGANPTGSFTLTLVADSVVDVTFTNNGGLTNPAAIRYTTQIDDFGTIEAYVQNVFSFEKKVATYLGPCLRVTRSSDNAQADIGFVANGMYSYFDTAAASAFKGASTTLWVEKLYNQNSLINPNDAVSPYTDSTQGIGVPADRPTLVLDAGDGFPAIVANNSRMDWESPLELATGQVIITNANYDPDGGYSLVSWSFVQFASAFGPGWNLNTAVTAPYDNVYGVYSDLISMSVPMEAGEFHVYTGSWTGGPLDNGVKTWRDGHLTGIGRSGSPYLTVDFHRNQINLFYTRFSNNRWYGKVRDIIAINGPVSDSLVATIHNRMITKYSTDDSVDPAPDLVLDFAANTYTVDGVGSSLAALVTGGAGPAPTRDAQGLICDGTQQFALQNAAKTAIQQANITLQIDTVAVTGPGGSNYKGIGYLAHVGSGDSYSFQGWDPIGQIYTGTKIQGSSYFNGIGGADQVPTDDDSIWYTGEKRHAVTTDSIHNTMAFAENGEIVSSWASTDLPAALQPWQDYYIGWWGPGDAGASSLQGRIVRIKIWRRKLTRHQLFRATRNVGTKGAVPSPFKMGLNCAGMEFGDRRYVPNPGRADFPPSAAEAAYYGVQFPNGIMRVPYTWERIQNTLNGPLDTAEINVLKGVVAANSANGLTTLLDMHNYATYYREDLGDYFGIDSPDTPGSLTTAHLVDVYTKLASIAEFNSASVWFGIMNEPFQYNSIAQWFQTCNSVAAAIRAHNVVSTITVPACVSATSARWWSKYSGTSFLANYNDTANKSVVEVHFYFDSDGSGTHPGSVLRGAAYRGFSNMVRWCRANNKRFIIGETGWEQSAVVSQSHCEAYDMFELLRQADDVFAGFCGWAGGTSWSNYFLGIEPYRAGILLDGFGDPAGARAQQSLMKVFV